MTAEVATEAAAVLKGARSGVARGRGRWGRHQRRWGRGRGRQGKVGTWEVSRAVLGGAGEAIGGSEAAARVVARVVERAQGWRARQGGWLRGCDAAVVAGGSEAVTAGGKGRG